MSTASYPLVDSLVLAWGLAVTCEGCVSSIYTGLTHRGTCNLAEEQGAIQVCLWHGLVIVLQASALHLIPASSSCALAQANQNETLPRIEGDNYSLASEPERGLPTWGWGSMLSARRARCGLAVLDVFPEKQIAEYLQDWLSTAWISPSR